MKSTLYLSELEVSFYFFRKIYSSIFVGKKTVETKSEDTKYAQAIQVNFIP